MDRLAAISIADLGEEFQLDSFVAEERLSQPFAITVVGRSENEIDFLPHLGEAVSIEVGERNEHIRYFHGRLTEAVLLNANRDTKQYRLTVRPWFYLLDQNRNYRIFQDMTVVDIAKQVFRDLQMNDVAFDKLTGAYRKREYCVQYKESDFNFLSRLFEDEGIYYYFKHEESAHKLILCDGRSAHFPAPGYESLPNRPVAAGQSTFPDSVSHWAERVSTAAQATVSLRSYDFAKPQSVIEGAGKGSGQHPGDALEVYEYLGDFVEKSVGEARGKNRLDAIRAQRRTFHGIGDAPGLACGGLVEITEAYIGSYNQEYLITGLTHYIDVEAYRSGGEAPPRRVELFAIPSSTPYRPLLVTPKPSAVGPETATVTGPEGEVVYVDDFGRVKVRFHWDRSPDAPGKTSCWMRVSHHSAGESFGHVVLPRVGQEVVIDFLDGDPDRPLITGRVYNGQRKHPYGLPTDKTRSVWRSQTIGEPGSYSGAEKQPPSGAGYNEIRFEDKGGSEEIYIRAQRERVTDVFLDDKLTVQRDRIDRVGRDRTVAVKKNESLTVEDGNETHTVQSGGRTTTIKQDDALTVEQGNLNTTVSQGNMDTQVKMGNYTMKTALGAVTIEAMQSITLKVGGNSIVIDQSGVTIKGIMVTSEASTVNAVKGAAQVDVKGAIVMIN